MIRDEEFSGELNNKATYIGFTALHYAVLIDNLDIAQFLIENGANPCLETEAGQKPLVYAKDGPMKEFLTQQTEKVLSDVCKKLLKPLHPVVAVCRNRKGKTTGGAQKVSVRRPFEEAHCWSGSGNCYGSCK